jgi:hypothetical protein
MHACESLSFSPVRACDNVLRLIAELDLAAIGRVALGQIGPRQFESCLREHAKWRRQYLRIRRLALDWEERRYGLVRAEVVPGAEPFPDTDARCAPGTAWRKHETANRRSDSLTPRTAVYSAQSLEDRA